MKQVKYDNRKNRHVTYRMKAFLADSEDSLGILVVEPLLEECHPFREESLTFADSYAEVGRAYPQQAVEEEFVQALENNPACGEKEKLCEKLFLFVFIVQVCKSKVTCSLGGGWE